MASKSFSSQLPIAKIALSLAVAGLVGFGLTRGTATKLAIFAAGFTSVGGGIGYLTGKQRGSGRLSRVQYQLNESNRALERSRLDAETYQSKVAESVEHLQNLTQQMNAIASQRDGLIDERDRAKSDALVMSSQINTAAQIAAQRLEDNELLAGQIEALEIERMSLIYELYETAVTEVEIAASIAKLEKQFESDRAYQVTQKKKAKSELTKARAGYHTELLEAQETIESLKAELADMTGKASGMISELSGDANSQLSKFELKLTAQNEQIQSLTSQLNESRKTVTALTHRRFDSAGTDNIYGNRLIDALAKRGSTYGAFHHEREGHNGRLKVWLTMIDAPLRRAQDALDDIEAELSLWAKPTVKVSRGMHLFTLATEQEHKVLEAPKVPLSRLEKTLDSAIHVRIVGGSGSGKTVLLNNLMHYMVPAMNGANVTLLDPKAVDDWGAFTPKYWGEECVTGIVALADGLKWRVNDTVQHRKSGKPAPEYEPELFVLDEAQYNYLLAQNADDSHIKERGEQAPNYAKKAKGALAGLLSLGRAYNAIGLFVTQLPQVSKIGLNEGSFDPCVNIFLGAQIDNAIDSFLPGSGFTDTKCKALSKELATRRKLGQEWVALITDIPRSEAYLMECPAPGYYHNRFSGDLGQSANLAGTAENAQSIAQTESQPCSESAGCKESASDLQAVGSSPASPKEPSAHCPVCSHLSSKYHGTKPQKNGKYRFICENSDCEKGAKKGTFSAFPLA